MKKIGLVIFMVIALSLFSANVVFCSEMRNLSFTQTIDSVKEGKLFEAKTWMKNGQVRMEYMAGEEMMVSIIKAGKIYNFSPIRKVGALMNVQTNAYGEQVGPEVIQSESELMEFLDLMQATQVGEETVLGKPCVIYEYMDNKNNVLNRIWLWKEKNVPIKSTIEINGDVITILYQDLKVSEDINDNIFDVPADIALDDYTKVEEKKAEVQAPTAEAPAPATEVQAPAAEVKEVPAQ